MREQAKALHSVSRSESVRYAPVPEGSSQFFNPGCVCHTTIKYRLGLAPPCSAPPPRSQHCTNFGVRNQVVRTTSKASQMSLLPGSDLALWAWELEARRRLGGPKLVPPHRPCRSTQAHNSNPVRPPPSPLFRPRFLSKSESIPLGRPQRKWPSRRATSPSTSERSG